MKVRFTLSMEREREGGREGGRGEGGRGGGREGGRGEGEREREGGGVTSGGHLFFTLYRKGYTPFLV